MDFFDDLEIRLSSEREPQTLAIFSKIFEKARQQTPWKTLLETEYFPEKLTKWADIKRLPVISEEQWRHYQQTSLKVQTKEGERFFQYYQKNIYPNQDSKYNESGFIRALFAAGVSHTSRIFYCPTQQPDILGLVDALKQYPGFVLEPLLTSPEEQIQIIQEYQPSFYLGSIDHLFSLLEKDTEGVCASFATAIFYEENIPNELRHYLQEQYQITSFHWMVHASAGCIAYESIPFNGWVVNEKIWVDIVYPGTRESVPFGEKGELILTCLDNRPIPILRLGSGLITAFLEGVSPCGRTAQRLSGIKEKIAIPTQIDQLGGISPEQLFGICNQFSEITKFRLHFPAPSSGRRPVLFCETGLASISLRKKIIERIQQITTADIAVHLCDINTLPKDGKFLSFANNKQYE
jgi:phenylacetate-CoA ligase